MDLDKDNTIRQDTNMQMQMQMQDDEIEIDLREIAWILLGRWKSILMAMLVGAVLLGAYCNYLLEPSYVANASIYIKNTDSVISLSDLQLSAALTGDYAKIIKSWTVLNRVIEELELDLDYEELGELIEVDNPDSTHIVEIRVTCNDPELSRNIANALTNISVNQISQIVGSGMPNVIDFSVEETVKQVMPSVIKYMAIGALLGAVLVCAIAVMQMLMDTTLKSADDIERYLDMPVLSSVPYYDEK